MIDKKKTSILSFFGTLKLSQKSRIHKGLVKNSYVRRQLEFYLGGLLRAYLKNHLKVYLRYQISKDYIRNNLKNLGRHLKSYLDYEILKGYLRGYIKPT